MGGFNLRGLWTMLPKVRYLGRYVLDLSFGGFLRLTYLAPKILKHELSCDAKVYWTYLGCWSLECMIHG